MRTIIATLKDLNDGMPKAFENFARKANFIVTDNTMFDCREIEVSKEIDDYFWKYYTDLGREKGVSDQDIKMSIAMMMLNNGAKRNENLEPWTVEMSEEFVSEKEDEE